MPEEKHPYPIAHNNAGQTDVIDGHDIVSLAISPHKKDLALLQQVFDHANWTLYKVPTYRERMLQLSHGLVHVIICDCQLSDGSWKDVLSHLAPWSERPRLIVISKHADERLWSEVLEMGGFDVLATPLEESETAYAVGTAWLDWNNQHGRAKTYRSMSMSR